MADQGLVRETACAVVGKLRAGEVTPLDLLGEMAGGFTYEVVAKRSKFVILSGMRCRVIDIDALIEAKLAAGRPKDLEVIAELEIIREERGA